MYLVYELQRAGLGMLMMIYRGRNNNSVDINNMQKR